MSARSKSCSVCGKPVKHGSRRCAKHGYTGPAGASGALVDQHTRYVDDRACQLFVASFPEGATEHEVAEAMGISRGLLRYLERTALDHFRARAVLVGIDPGDRIHKGSHELAGTWCEEVA